MTDHYHGLRSYTIVDVTVKADALNFQLLTILKVKLLYLVYTWARKTAYMYTGT